MSNARLLSQIILTSANNELLAGKDAVTELVTIPPGIYWWTSENTAEDFAKAFNVAWEAAFGVGDLAISAGIGFPQPLFEGEPGVDYTLNFGTSGGATTLDPRLLGIPTGTSDVQFTAQYQAPHQHRYGWYPQGPLLANLPALQTDVYVSFTPARRKSVVDFGEYFVAEWRLEMVHRALMRIEAALEASAVDVGLTLGDENCALERFMSDVVRNGLHFRVYDGSTYRREWVVPQSVLTRNPLGLSRIKQAAGEKWSCILEGVEAND